MLAVLLTPDKLWKEGSSAKEKGRGLGLSSYQQIQAGYANVATSPSWAEDVVVHKLTVEGRS